MGDNAVGFVVTITAGAEVIKAPVSELEVSDGGRVCNSCVCGQGS